MRRRGRASSASGTTRSSWLVTMLIAVAALLGLGGLSVMIDYEGWVRTVVVMVIAVALIVAGVRRRTRSAWIPTVVGAIVSLVFLMWGYAERADGSHHLVPTPGAMRDLNNALAAGIQHANESTIPVTATPGFAALVAASLLAMFLLAELLAVSWGLTATAGILLLLAWLPAAILQHQVSIRLLMLAIACWVGAMVLSRRQSSTERPGNPLGALVTMGAVVAVAVMIAPVAVGAPGWGAIPRFETPGALDGTTRLNLALDLRSSLTTKSGTTVMVYASSGKKPDTLRLYTLTDFDGNSWTRDQPTKESVPATAGVLWPTGVNDWEGRERERLDIQIRGLSESNLPLPSAPRTVDVGQSWSYFPGQDEVTSEIHTTKDLFYSVVTDLDYHQQDALVAAQSEIDDGADAEVDARYLELAPAIDVDRIQAVAQDVTDRTETRYDQALALQQYLRSPLDFTYDTTVTPTGSDSVSEFLDSQTGYCVQFGTTMVVLARSLGIPARLAVGFLGGEATDDNTFVVRGSDAHAWPELYFADEGWVRFEPTPAIQTGTPPKYADPTAGIENSTFNIPERGAPERLDSPDNFGNPAPDVGSGVTSAATSAPVVSWWAVAGLLVVIAGLVAAHWWRRRVRTTRAVTEPERAWRILKDRLGPSIGWPSALTPLEAAEHIESGLRPLHAHLSNEGIEALARVTAAVSDARYGFGDAAGGVEGELEADASAVAEEVKAATKGKTAAR